MHVQGKGSCKFEIGDAENSETHSHTQYYSNCKRTVFGNVHKTPILRNAGANAVFGTIWAPDEGVLQLGVPFPTEQIILRVMDYDWCKKDDLLGEAVVSIAQYLNVPFVVLPLYHKGKKLKSTIVFSIQEETRYVL